MAETMRDLLLSHHDSDRPAIKFDDEVITWREFVVGSKRRASAIHAQLNDDRPRHVGTLLDNVPEIMFALAAGALGGYVTAGINTTRRGEGLARDIRTADCQILLTDGRYAPLLEGLDLGDVRIINVASDEWDDLVADATAPSFFPERGARDPFMLIFTSGTSGNPKAVRVANSTVVMSGSMLADSHGLTARDVFYLSMPTFHSNAILGGVGPAWVTGGTMVLARQFSASRFLPDVRRYGVTYMNYVGKPLAYILDTPARPDDAKNTLRLAFGNEAASKDIPAFAERFGCKVSDAYGSTELAIIVVRTENSPLQSIGEPFPGVAVFDPFTGTECPRAEYDDSGAINNLDECIGELVNTEGAGFFSGYYNNPDATNERMRDGKYWSGDLAYRDADGYIFMAGRTGDWLRVDGENMATGIIEEIILRHPAVSRAAVYALPDPRGVGDQIVAALVPRHDAHLTPEGFQAFLERQDDLSPKAWPRWVRLAETLPMTATNKILKRELQSEGLETRDELWERAEHGHEYSAVGSGVPA
jgi:fatty-acyl-CoA synthase